MDNVTQNLDLSHQARAKLMRNQQTQNRFELRRQDQCRSLITHQCFKPWCALPASLSRALHVEAWDLEVEQPRATGNNANEEAPLRVGHGSHRDLPDILLRGVALDQAATRSRVILGRPRDGGCGRRAQQCLPGQLHEGYLLFRSKDQFQVSAGQMKVFKGFE